MEAPDPHTLIIKTDTPYPLLPTELSNWGVLSAEFEWRRGRHHLLA